MWTNVWLADWTGDVDGTHSPWYYLNCYAIISGVQLLSQLLNTIEVARLGLVRGRAGQGALSPKPGIMFRGRRDGSHCCISMHSSGPRPLRCSQSDAWTALSAPSPLRLWDPSCCQPP